MKTGHKSVKAHNEHLKNNIRKKKTKKPDYKPELSIKIDFSSFCDQLKKVSEMIKNAFEQFKMVLNNAFPNSPIHNTWLQLQMADNKRPNRFLIGWGRIKEGV